MNGRSSSAARAADATARKRANSSIAIAGPIADAVGLFDRGMRALQVHAFADGATAFRDLLARFPGERALLDRARVYLELCERERQRRPVAPQTIEEHLTAATAALNDEDTGRAEKLIKAVLAEDPRQDLALYLFAVLEVRRGNTAAAVARLGDAIALSPEAAAQARFDPDFAPLRGMDAFRRLTDTGGARNGAGSGRRGR